MKHLRIPLFLLLLAITVWLLQDRPDQPDRGQPAASPATALPAAPLSTGGISSPSAAVPPPPDANPARTAFYAGARELAVRSEATDTPGVIRRTRLLRTSLHRPLVRSVETVESDAGDWRITDSLAMSADHVVVHLSLIHI